MNDQASPPDGEKPRFLLPEGCSDLIDVLRRAKTEELVRLIHAGAGHSAKAYPASETAPNGLAALPRYVKRLFKVAKPHGMLTITAPQCPATFRLHRAKGEIRFVYYHDPALWPEGDASIRTFAARHGLSTVRDQPFGETGRHCFMYLLPATAEAVTALCRELLVEHWGVRSEDKSAIHVAGGFPIVTLAA